MHPLDASHSTLHPSVFNPLELEGMSLEDAQALHDYISSLTLAQLAAAIKAKELGVRLQPIVTLVDKQVVGFEALVRWKHPIYGLLRPAFFLKRLIRVGLSSEVTRYMIQRAARFQFNAIKEGVRWVPISVNVSGPEFNDKLIVIVKDAIEKHQLPAGALSIEMTESEQILDKSSAQIAVKRLKHMGVNVYSDDFGHAYASLRNLLDFPFSGIKLDRSFTTAMAVNPMAATLIHQVLEMCLAMNLTLTVEGIENEAQAAELKILGVTHGQGYLYNKPMQRIEAFKLLKASQIIE